MNKLKFGLLAEYIIIAMYTLKFYHIIRHRMRNYCGEIDIIAARGKEIVFIEVKARNSIINDKLISKNQQERIKKAALLYLTKNIKFAQFQVRFDLALITPYKLPIIFKNAW